MRLLNRPSVQQKLKSRKPILIGKNKLLVGFGFVCVEAGLKLQTAGYFQSMKWALLLKLFLVNEKGV